MLAEALVLNWSRFLFAKHFVIGASFRVSEDFYLFLV